MKTKCVVVAILAVAAMGANLVTQKQALVMGALEELKYKSVPNKDGLIGGPADFEVDDDTIEFLEKLHKDGSTIIVDPDGRVEIDGKEGDKEKLGDNRLLVANALKYLKFQAIKSASTKFTVSKTTVEQNKKWHKEKTTLVVGGDGTVTVKK